MQTCTACKDLLIRLRGLKLFSYSTQLSTKFIQLINVKMPTIVGILTFISMINTIPERLKSRNFICRFFSFYEQLKFQPEEERVGCFTLIVFMLSCGGLCSAYLSCSELFLRMSYLLVCFSAVLLYPGQAFTNGF